jgi:serine protease AprX
MAVLDERLVKFVLMSGRAGRRFIGESTVLLSVWTEYAKAAPGYPVDLLVTPWENIPAARLARDIHNEVKKRGEASPQILPLERALVCRLSLDDFVRSILSRTGADLGLYLDEVWSLLLDHVGAERQAPTLEDLLGFTRRFKGNLSPPLREAILVLMIYAASRQSADTPITMDSNELPRHLLEPDMAELRKLAKQADGTSIWRVAINRQVRPSMISIETIKADAARQVFDISCAEITWAVIDSGIDGAHPAFLDLQAEDGSSRVDRAFNFGQLRDIASYDLLLSPAQTKQLVASIQAKLSLGKAEATKWLQRLRDDATDGRPYDWEMLSRLLEVDPGQFFAVADTGPAVSPPGHGTHVAGILGGYWEVNGKPFHQGVCRDIRLYDLRVLSSDLGGTEVAVIAALEFVRWLNGRNDFISIHGVNISLAIQHDLGFEACGHTPVCEACEATVNSGVAVVVAAGNRGAELHTPLDEDSYAGYATVSIADPGNAQSVITVGATHRERPHEYGVSYFSSRGPTGDGRAKPDVVAPGERIDGPLPNLGYGRLDGTSMAAPHVSGVAALLMARNPDLIGDPLRVKDVIVKSATDLGRVRDFQGAGLVDALRALQSV